MAAQTLIRNVVLTGFTRVAAVLLGIAVPIIVARHLGPVYYGYYVSLFSFLTIIDYTLENALMKIAVREIAETPDKMAEWVTAATLIRLVFGILGILGCLIFVHVAHFPSDVRLASYVGCLLLLINPFRTPIAIFRAHLNMQWELAVTLTSRLIEPFLVLWFAYRGGGLALFLLARIVSSFIYSSVAWTIGKKKFGLRIKSDIASLTQIARKALPLGIEALLVTVQLKGDILILTLFWGPVAGGLYGAVAQITEFAMLAPDIVLTPVFPVLTRSYSQSLHDAFQNAYQRTFDLFMMFVVPIAVAVTFYPEVAIRILFGSKYLAAAPALQGLVWVIVLMYFAGLTGIAVVAINRQNSLARVQVANVLAYLAINLSLIPYWNFKAAVLSRIVAVIMGAVLTYRIVLKGAGYSLRMNVIRIIAMAAVAMTFVILISAPAGITPALLMGSVVYLTMIWFFYGKAQLLGMQHQP